MYDALIDRFDLVQIPVEAEPVRGRGWYRWLISSHYSSEFAEAHAKQIVIREALGAAVPSAGVGCAIGRRALARVASGRAGPFDPGTLTEDYELGLRIGVAGGRGVFVRLPAADGQGIVAVRACFPDTIETAAKQKARWITGIALAGWDRLGWSGGLAERWMRLRDRRAPIAALLLLCAYTAMLLWAVVAGRALLTGQAPAVVLPRLLIDANLWLLGWRVVVRGGFVGATRGWRIAALTPVHLLIGNLVAIIAAARAIGLYVGIVRTGQVRWDKTTHVFPGYGT